MLLPLSSSDFFCIVSVFSSLITSFSYSRISGTNVLSCDSQSESSEDCSSLFFLSESMTRPRETRSAVSSFTSVALDKNPLCLFTLPPDIEPPAFSTSPSSVTTLNLYPNFLLIAMALSMLSVTTTLPSSERNMPSYFLSYLISSDAIPIYPADDDISAALSSVLPFTDVTGRKVARPPPVFLRYAIAAFASCSDSTIMFCSAPPRAVSIASTYLFSTSTRPDIVPYIESPFSSFAVRTAFTLRAYPA